MAVPSRVYVGVLLFALIATLLVGGYTIQVLRGVDPAADKPYQVFFPEEKDATPVFKAFLIMATAFCVVLTAWAMRSLLAAARRDALVRRLVAEGRWPPKEDAPKVQPTVAQQASAPTSGYRRDDGPPPGYQ